MNGRTSLSLVKTLTIAIVISIPCVAAHVVAPGFAHGPIPTPGIYETPGPETVLPSPPVLDACDEAFNACDFTFGYRKALSVFNIPSKPDVVFTDRITFKNGPGHVGIINTGSFIPQFIDDAGNAESITASGTPAFSPSTFKTFTIPSSQKSGVGHQVLKVMQPMDAKGRCVRIFFKAYQILNAKGYVQSNVNLENITPGACIVFRSGM